MKKIVLYFFFISLSSLLYAQNIDTHLNADRPESNVNLNLFGDASIISVNYEKLFFINSRYFLAGNIGIGYNEEFQLCIFEPCSPPDKYITFPHHITGNLGKGRHFFEFGLGGTMVSGNVNQKYFLYPIIGYRIQPINSNKVNFRLFASYPFSSLEDTNNIPFIPIGVTIGFSFN